MRLEDLGAAVVGSHDVQQPPASLAAVPARTHMGRHLGATALLCPARSLPGSGYSRLLRVLLPMQEGCPMGDPVGTEGRNGTRPPTCTTNKPSPAASLERVLLGEGGPHPLQRWGQARLGGPKLPGASRQEDGPVVTGAAHALGPCCVPGVCGPQAPSLPWLRVSLVGISGAGGPHLGFLWETTHSSPGPCSLQMGRPTARLESE